MKSIPRAPQLILGVRTHGTTPLRVVAPLPPGAVLAIACGAVICAGRLWRGRAVDRQRAVTPARGRALVWRREAVMTGRPISWFQRGAVIAIGVVTATLVTVAFVVQGQGWGQLCPTATVIAVALGLGLAWFLPWRSRRMAGRHLAGRPPMDAATFGATFFSDLPRGPEIAAVVRGRLEEQLKMELPGLRPEDRFADLRAEVDPILLDELAEEIGFSPPNSYQEFSALAASLPTVRALVEYVAQQTSPGE
jgi:hypothetical protein